MGIFSDSEKDKNRKIRNAITSAMKKKLKDAVGKCEKCRKKGHLDVHHIKSVSSGGTNTPGNVIMLCPNCHSDCHRGSTTQSSLKKIVQKRSNILRKEIAAILRDRKKVEGRDTREKGFLESIFG